MASLVPVMASETTAAKLLDMKPPEFCALVKAGHLPKGKEIAPGIVRWDVETLRQICSGQAIEGGGIAW